MITDDHGRPRPEGPDGPERSTSSRGRRSSTARAPGKQITQLDIARAAGVSRSAVSHVLNQNGRISEATRDRVLRAAREMGYRPHGTVCEPASRRSRRLVVILPYLDNPFFDTLVRHLRHYAVEAGRALVVMVSDLEAGLERATIEQARRIRPSGLILPGTRLEPEELERLGRSLPVCLLDRTLTGSTLRTARMDEDEAAEQVVRHLHGLGHRHMAFLAPAAALHEHLVAERGGACVRAALRHGMSAEEIPCNAGALLALESALDQRSAPVAVVAYNDLLAANVVAAAHHLGKRVGPDLAVASYDNTRLASHPQLDLTSVDQDPEQLASAAVELLTGARRGGAATPPGQQDGDHGRDPAGPSASTRMVRPRLVVRSSTNRPT